jgi:coenzyme F420-reducing hydrogenase gamma subunit
MKRRLRVGIFKLSSCDGCQAVLLDLREAWDYMEVKHWVLGGYRGDVAELDLALVEGSVSTEEEEELVRSVRERAELLVALGACATSGGIQALRNFINGEECLSLYPRREFIKVLPKATPVKDHVKVDYEIYGCPVSPRILENFIKALLHNKRPEIPDYPLCMECKLHGNPCVMDAYGIPCLGPVVRAGCGALCPSVKRGCYGCFGPCREPNTEALVSWLRGMGMSEEEIRDLFANENAYSEEFRRVLEGEVG